MRFQKPTPEEVTNYARKIGFILDGNQFCDFYESKGWKVGSSPMKVWQAAVRTWKHKEPRADRWGDPKPLQAPPDANKVQEARKRMEDRRQREWDRRELVRLAQERDDARSRKMMDATGEKDKESREILNRLAIPVEITRCRDEAGNKWAEDWERRGSDED